MKKNEVQDIDYMFPKYKHFISSKILRQTDFDKCARCLETGCTYLILHTKVYHNIMQ